MGWGGRWEGGSGWGIHVNPWLIQVNVWQNPLQYCKVISLQLIKINGGRKKRLPVSTMLPSPGVDTVSITTTSQGQQHSYSVIHPSQLLEALAPSGFRTPLFSGVTPISLAIYLNCSTPCPTAIGVLQGAVP